MSNYTDQDAEPPTPDGQEPDIQGADTPEAEQEPGSHPDPDPGASADQAGRDG